MKKRKTLFEDGQIYETEKQEKFKVERTVKEFLPIFKKENKIVNLVKIENVDGVECALLLVKDEKTNSLEKVKANFICMPEFEMKEETKKNKK